MSKAVKTRARQILELAEQIGSTGVIVRQMDAHAKRGRCVASHFEDIRAGRFPRPVKLGPRACGYDEAVFLAEEQLRKADQAAWAPDEAA